MGDSESIKSSKSAESEKSKKDSKRESCCEFCLDQCRETCQELCCDCCLENFCEYGCFGEAVAETSPTGNLACLCCCCLFGIRRRRKKNKIDTSNRVDKSVQTIDQGSAYVITEQPNSSQKQVSANDETRGHEN